jgi:hypothetical protein
LKHNDQSKVDGKELRVELRLLKDMLPKGKMVPVDIVRFVKR